MPSLISEHQVWPDTAGQPIVNGKIYIGTQNTDPISNLISIYSDRALSVSISNPQSTDSYGRATNKIWVPAKYSIQVNDSAGVQQYIELDAGDPETTGITTLTNVLGTDTITADGTPTISALADNQQYNFRAANTNTGAVTLQIDLTSAKTIKKQHDIDLVAGDIEQNQTVSVIYNATDDTFELVSNVSIGDVVNLNVTGDFTYQGVIQPVLTDYAEGTWTPEIWDSSNSGAESQTYSVNAGSYTKIGRLVYVHGQIQVTSLGTLTGGDDARIGNLPFGIVNDGAAGQNPGIVIPRQGIDVTAGDYISLRAVGTSDYLQLTTVALSTIPQVNQNMTITELSADGHFEFSMTYYSDE